MKRRTNRGRAVAWPLAATALALAIGIPAAALGAPASTAAELMDACLSADTSYTYSERTGLLNFVASQTAEPLQRALTGGAGSPEEAARAYLSACGALFGLRDTSAELRLSLQSPAEEGSSVVKFQQTYLGVPVFAGELNLQIDSAHGVQFVNGEILPAISLDVEPTVSASQARSAALTSVADEHQLSSTGASGEAASAGLQVTAPELWIYDPALIDYEGPTVLVWRMEVSQNGPPPVRQLVLVDAHNGAVVLSLNQLDTARNRMTYDMNNVATYPGTLRCNEANPNCTGGDADEASAHVFAGDTYDFYKTYHARDSIDGAGMTINSHVHYSSGYCNAFWNGSRMTYGDGCAIVVDDVVAHEITHGVTEYESNLVYANQSGAINEAFSDIWGEFVDLTNAKGTDTPAVRWLMGEDASIGAIRNMKNPPSFNDPDRMGSPLYYKGTDDNGGVHSNSGVANKAAYLITDGATFNGYTVTGIGIPKTARIFYKVQKDILTSNATYAGLGNALSTACNLLVGQYSITAANCEQVRQATYATEMVTPPPAPISPAGDISDKTPTYTWTPLPGATNYRYRVLDETGAVAYASPVLASTVCSASKCTHTPTNTLALGAYKWKVRAKVSGAWKPFSALQAFKVAAQGFNSRFTSNAKGWTPVTGSWSVADGYYQTNGVSNSYATSAYATDFSTLTYEARIKRTGTCTGCANLIVIRGAPTATKQVAAAPVTSNGQWDSAYSFNYSNNGYVSIWSYTGGVESPLLSWTPSSAIVQNGWNTLKVSINATNGWFQWYINDTLVASGNLTAKSTGKVGVGFYRDAAAGHLDVDRAKLVESAPASIIGAVGGVRLDESAAGVSRSTAGNPEMSP